MYELLGETVAEGTPYVWRESILFGEGVVFLIRALDLIFKGINFLKINMWNLTEF